MDKEQVAHELAMLAVKSRLEDHKAEYDELGLNNYADLIVEDYRCLIERIKKQL